MLCVVLSARLSLNWVLRSLCGVFSCRHAKAKSTSKKPKHDAEDAEDNRTATVTNQFQCHVMLSALLLSESEPAGIGTCAKARCSTSLTSLPYLHIANEFGIVETALKCSQPVKMVPAQVQEWQWSFEELSHLHTAGSSLGRFCYLLFN